MKANQVYITINFPEFIYIEEKNQNKKRLELIEQLEKDSLEIIQTPLWNPLDQAQEKLQKKKLESLSHSKDIYRLSSEIFGPNSQAFASIARVDPFRAMAMPKIPNVHGNDDYLDSEGRIIVKRGNLLHTLECEYNDYYLFPLVRGIGNIIVNLHCEEYPNEEIIEIPIIVE